MTAWPQKKARSSRFNPSLVSVAMSEQTSSSVSSIPRHIAIIMDGNGRWAAARGLHRIEGHRRGAETTQKVIEAARDMGVAYVTLFAFSSENWSRPANEVTALMELLRYYLKKETSEMHKSGLCLRVIGDRSRLPADIVTLIDQAEAVTRDNTAMTVVIALSYGGRQDITAAARQLATLVAAGEISLNDIDEDLFAAALSTGDIPDPDLLIRTSGEKRVSNFLMWQMAYSELYFTEAHWPDFTADHLRDAVAAYSRRERRFGGVADDTPSSARQG